jgi:4-hydroxy-tetrahydrodipicolinate reductase
MGSLIETLAASEGHSVTVIVTEHHDHLRADQLAETLSAADVAIDFSAPEAVRRNVEACVAANVPIVEGTTGWNDQRLEIAKLVSNGDGAMVFGANFSIGVNLFYRIADFAAELLARFPEYEAFIEEQHHSRKKDAPSGTALKIKDVISRHVEVGDVVATRAGNIPGTHRVGFDGPADQILLEHLARSREGFALGAIRAAEWIMGRKGVYEFGEVMDQVCGRE